MKKSIFTGAIALLVAGVVFVPNVKAETLSIVAQIEALRAQLVELQQELAKLQGEVKDLIKEGLKEGMNDHDITKIQELLATDSDLYPEGLVTGYFGSLTRKALMRFQERHEIPASGRIDEDTRGLLEEYLSEGLGDKIPSGLLKTPGIMKKVEMHYRDGCDDDGRVIGPLCNRLHIKYQDDDNSDDDNSYDNSDDNSNDDSYDDSDESDVEVETEGENNDDED